MGNSTFLRKGLVLRCHQFHCFATRDDIPCLRQSPSLASSTPPPSRGEQRYLSQSAVVEQSSNAETERLSGSLTPLRMLPRYPVLPPFLSTDETSEMGGLRAHQDGGADEAAGHEHILIFDFTTPPKAHLPHPGLCMERVPGGHLDAHSMPVPDLLPLCSPQ